MKRSEMLEIINDIIFYNNAGFGSDKLANEILSELELKGMKPPVKKRCPVLLTDAYVWEPEENNG